MKLQRLLGNIEEIKNYSIQSYGDTQGLGFIGCVVLDWDKIKSENKHVNLKAGPAVNRYLFSNKKKLTFTLDMQNRKILLKMTQNVYRKLVDSPSTYESEMKEMVEDNFELMITFLKSQYDLKTIVFREHSDEAKENFEPSQELIDILIKNSVSFRYENFQGEN